MWANATRQVTELAYGAMMYNYSSKACSGGWHMQMYLPVWHHRSRNIKKSCRNMQSDWYEQTLTFKGTWVFNIIQDFFCTHYKILMSFISSSEGRVEVSLFTALAPWYFMFSAAVCKLLLRSIHQITFFFLTAHPNRHKTCRDEEIAPLMSGYYSVSLWESLAKNQAEVSHNTHGFSISRHKWEAYLKLISPLCMHQPWGT